MPNAPLVFGEIKTMRISEMQMTERQLNEARAVQREAIAIADELARNQFERGVQPALAATAMVFVAARTIALLAENQQQLENGIAGLCRLLAMEGSRCRPTKQ
jgi:selenocysteine-specific translation elongation factor